MARPKKALQAKGDSEWIRERLLDAAEALFARKGYDATGLRDIGLRVGVSNATVLHHFGSKLALYRAVLDRLALATKALVESVETDPHEPPLSALLEFLGRFGAWTQENPNYGHIAFREFTEKIVRDSHLDYHIEADVLRRLGEIVKRGQQEGAFRVDVDVDTFLVQLLTTVWLGEVSTETWAMLFFEDREWFAERFRQQAMWNLLRALVVDERGLDDALARPNEVETLQ